MAIAVTIATVYILHKFIKEKNKISKCIFCIMTFLIITSFWGTIYAKYMLSRNFYVSTSSANFWFDVLANTTTLEFVDNKSELNLTVKNNDGTNYNTFDTTYEISLLNNENFTFSIGNEKFF